jgi:hypothetical protein
MPDILAIISKAVFEKDAQRGGRRLAVGDVLPMDRYLSANRVLEPLAGGARLFLATVRPPDERLWLVAVLEALSFRDGAWIAAAPNRVPITDISSLRASIRFESGKGMSQDKGALGMSLQTPRVLAAVDIEQLLAAAGASPAPTPAAAPPGFGAEPGSAGRSPNDDQGFGAEPGSAGRSPSDDPGPEISPAARALLEALAGAPADDALREKAARCLMAEGAWGEAMKVLDGQARLNAHDPPHEGGLPCLCRACLAPAPAEVTVGGVTFDREFVIKGRRVLFFWAPRVLSEEARSLRSSVRGALAARLAVLDKRRKRQARPAF